MLPIEKQVCSKELSKKLKQLKIKQESLFYWVGEEKDKMFISNTTMCYKRSFDNPEEFEYPFNYSAFTVAELGEILPKGIQINKGLHYGHWIVEFGNNWSKESKKIINKNESLADSLAKMIIYLIENKLIVL